MLKIYITLLNNCYKRWSIDDKITLIKKFDKGESLKNLSYQFGRSEGAIKSKLKLLKKL